MASSTSSTSGNPFLNFLGATPWTGVGVLVAGEFSLISLYYIQQQTFWLYFAALLAGAFALFWGFYRTQKWSGLWYLAAMTMLIAAAGSAGLLQGSERTTAQFQPTVAAFQTAAAVQQPTVQALQTSVALAAAQPKTPELVLASSAFDDNADNWTVVGNAKSIVFKNDGGRAGSYISVEDNGEGPDWFWKAPQKFIGNQSAAYGGLLLYSLTQNDSTQPYTGTIDIILRGPDDMRLTYNVRDPGVGWTEYAIPLHELEGWMKRNGEAPTQAEMQRVLSSLQSLEIRGEYRSGHDTGGLDEVSLLRRP